AFAFLWTKHTGNKWSWVCQLGTNSLLVYWVHIELLYGRWLGAWHSGLSIEECTVAAVAVILSMVLLSAIRTHHKQWGEFLSSLRPQPELERVSGDGSSGLLLLLGTHDDVKRTVSLVRARVPDRNPDLCPQLAFHPRFRRDQKRARLGTLAQHGFEHRDLIFGQRGHNT